MSKIQAELSKATGVSQKPGQDRQAFFILLLVAVSKLSDAEWNALSVPAQDWFNDAADAREAKKPTLPEMPDYVAEAAPKTTSRRRAAEPEPEPTPASYEPAVGDFVDVTTKRGSSYPNAEIVEIGDDFVAIQPDGTTDPEDQLEVALVGTTFVPVAGEAAEGEGEGVGEEEDAGPFEPAVGDLVTVTNKRGKVTTGEIVEIDDAIVVVKPDDGTAEVEFAKDRIESIVPVGGGAQEEAPAPAPAPAPVPAASSRRRAAEDTPPVKEDKAAPKEDKKATRSGNPRGVSVGARVREIMAENLDIEQGAVEKILKAEGLEFREPTLNLIYKDTSQFISLLRGLKKIK